MTTSALLIVALMFIVLIGAAVAWLLFANPESNRARQVESLLARQRGLPSDPSERAAMFTAMDGETSESSIRTLTLQRRLKYAQMSMSPATYWFFVVGIGTVSFVVASRFFAFFLSVFFAFLGYLIMNTMVNWQMNRRTNAFDRDYPQFLMSLVGLLKTGMNTLSALQASAEGLEPGALVREEVELMLERLRFGVLEEKSIGSFGEDIHHPEIELFVQALLLNKRLGGNLSDTLERLAKQVRRRQYFRQAAIAAIGLQRGSLWFIIMILVFIQGYLYFVMPETISYSLKDEVGWMAWQGAFLIIILGILWLQRVTKIRV